MLREHLLIAWRTLKRDPLFALLNIGGLAIGITACLLIWIYVQDELSFDAHHAKADRIHRIQTHYVFGDTHDDFGIAPFPTVRTLVREYPELEGGTQLMQLGEVTLEHEGRPYVSEDGYYADTAFFRTFDFTWKHGGPEALDAPDDLVITDKLAARMFGDADPIGKLVQRNGRSLRVAGVIDADAINTHIPLGVFLSMKGLPPPAEESLSDNWGNNNSFSYLVFREGADPVAFQEKMDAFVAKYVLPSWQGMGFNGSIRFDLEPLKDVHFNDTLIYDTPKKGNRAYVTLLAVVAVLILLIACINFINMSTAGATRRAKEVALRKVAGARKEQLVAQFIGGSTLVALLAIGVSLLLVMLALPAFGELSGKDIDAGRLLSGGFVGVLLLVLLVVGVLAGSYPAFFLSRFAPQLLLKEGVASAAGKQRVRKVLMGLQFAIALFMGVGTLVVFAQLHWLRTTDMGFRKDQLLAVTMPQPPPNDTLQWSALRTVKTELMREHFVKGAAFTWAVPGEGGGRWVLRVKTPEGKVDKPMPVMTCDADFPELIGLQLVEGRMFDPEVPTDAQSAVVVNESAVKAFGWDDPLSEALYAPGDSVDQELRVIGVVKDFHYTSLHTPIEPLALFQSDPRYGSGTLMLRLEGGDTGTQLAELEERWAEVMPGADWEAAFLDDSIARLYAAEDTLFRVFTAFAVLTLVLTAMGLFGLAAFTAKRRTREIGVRRVLGASLGDVVRLLNREFLILLGVAALLAFPLAAFAAQRWLEGFAYHTGLSVLHFFGALVVTLLITVLTVSWHAWRTVHADPVQALRHE